MNNNKYNGWTNYATWRVNLEILGDIQFEDKTSADDLKEIVEDCVFRTKYWQPLIVMIMQALLYLKLISTK